ncbi:hypothetical protein SAMN05444004_12531 [Jannaschia faecimaris]|uniref:Restriction endonuclease AspBHI N-terminal domain-containing protein n=1 Tax=Jannaschia faecimaris TaxID=1244108 RepID=A0A1H3U8A9_9RHOB|nr:hypothetical protein [Jannaschia faecimaris]SDZ58527.1 hypothetical protein SAMN05444004_12531 [Jannaschia faecimaris]
MKIGEIFRDARPKDPTAEIINGYPNVYYHTATPGQKLIPFESGINRIAEVAGPDGVRRPAIIVTSSPHKIGSVETPWQDFFDPDNGHVRYYGDNKTPGRDPALAAGNKAMLDAKRLQDAMERDIRQLAPPIILFRRMTVNGKAKGFPSFQGVGLIDRAELISQYDGQNGCSFPNYAFDIVVLDLAPEFEEFDWRWVSDRRDAALSRRNTEKFAPSAWKAWVKEGEDALPKVRRQVTKLMTTPVAEQRPPTGSREAAALDQIYRFYEGRKHRFEILAARVAGRIFKESGGTFHFGWVTRPSSDGGADFIGRLDIGSGFSKVKQVVFGQAKCESPESTTSGRDIARTVARLRRGWIGAYVTLGAFSLPVQREVIDDEYPLLLVPGERVAREVMSAATAAGCSSVSEYLELVDAQYEDALVDRRPEQVLRQ